MLINERQTAILEYLRRQPSVSVAQLSERFQVSAVTIRKDLNALSEAGSIERTHGGAVSVHKSRYEADEDEKERVHNAGRLEIAEKALELVEEGSTIILDAGSTTMELARRIKEAAIPDVTIITHALNIAWLFRDDPNYGLIIIGGQYRRGIMSCVGPYAVHMFGELHADRSFLGINGYTLEDGLTTPSPYEAEMKRMIIERSRECYLLADTKKYGRVCMSRSAEVTSLTGIVTDADFPDSLRRTMEEKGLDIL